MPYAAAVNDAFQVKILGRIEGQQTVNVFHFVCVGASDDVLTHLILVFIQCFIDNLLPVLASTWTLEQVKWQRVSPTVGTEFISVPVGAGAGGGSTAALPSYASCVFSERTEFAGKSGRGRKYFAGIPENQTDGSLLLSDGPFWAGALAFAACVIAAFVHPDPAGGTNIFDLSVYSRKIGGQSLPYGASGFHAVREFVPSRELGTTRSRKLGRGI